MDVPDFTSINLNLVLNNAINLMGQFSINSTESCNNLLNTINVLEVLCNELIKNSSKNVSETFMKKVLFEFCIKLSEKELPQDIKYQLFNLFTTCCNEDSTKTECLGTFIECLTVFIKLAIQHDDFNPAIFTINLQLIYRTLNSIHSNSDFCVKLQDDLFQHCCNVMLMDTVNNEQLQVVIAIVNCLLHVDLQIIEERIKKLWSCFQTLLNTEEDIRLFMILSSLLPSFSSSVLIRQPMFWVLIQEGLLNRDPLTRKRSVYILKYLLNIISEENTFQTNEDIPVFFWNKAASDELWNIWKTVILILESLDEKQLHVVQPCLSSFEDILKATINKITENGYVLHISWLFVIIRRALNHEARPLQKWAFLYSLKLPVEKLPLLWSETGSIFIFKHLLPGLQSMAVYSLEENSERCSPPIILELLQMFLQACLNMLEHKDQLVFCEKMLNVVFSFGFNELVLCYITKAVSKLVLSVKLSEVHVEMFKSFIYSKLPIVRNEYQKVIFHNLILFFTVNTEPTKDVFLSVVNILVPGLSMNLCPLNGKCWNTLTKLLKKIDHVFLIESTEISIQNLKNTVESFEIHKSVVFAFCAVLNLNTPINIIDGINYITDIVQKLPSNPYLDEKKILNALLFLEFSFQLLMNASPSTRDFDSFVAVLSSYSSFVLDYTYILYDKMSTTIVNEKLICNCIALLQLQVAYAKDEPSLNGDLESFIDKIWLTLLNNVKQLAIKCDGFNFQEFCHKATTLKLLLCLIKHNMVKLYEVVEIIKCVSNFTICLNRSYINNLCKAEKSDVFNCNSVVYDCWEALELLSTSLEVTYVNNDQMALLKVLLNDFDIVSNDHLKSLLSFATHLVGVLKHNDDALISIIDSSWRVLLGQLKTDRSFWVVCKMCMQVVFHRELLLCNSDAIFSKVSHIWKEVLSIGENKAGVINILLHQCIATWQTSENEKCLMNYLNLFIQICLFGPLPKKNEKQRSELIHYLRSLKFYDNIETLISLDTQHQNVRVTFINFILNMNPNPGWESFRVNLLLELINYEKTLSKPKLSYYSNSETHRRKIRIWQTILVLMNHVLSIDTKQIMFSKLCETFQYNNQPSVRYYIEWALVLLIYSQPELLDLLWTYLDAATEKKIMSVTSVFSVCILYIKVCGDHQFKEFVRKSIFRFLPWAQAQHLSSRIHAQVTLQSIWRAIKVKNDIDLLSEFAFLEHCFALKEHNTSAVKYRLDLLQSPFYSKFHPLKHYTLQTIFYGFLTLTDYAPEEYIDVENFLYKDQESLLKKQNNGELLVKQCVSKTEINDSSGMDLIDMQKKIMPWRVSPPSEDILMQSEMESKRQSKVSDLVLCAVLVDKIPNIGGLCRTAEIFGVGSIVIASHRYLCDPNFRSLSVTSEKWINVEQVVPVKLPKWLEEMKQNGYLLVGVEQTANSKMVGDYKFPKKTVLILGNEKTGIPVNLIQQLDECVEIPQFGIIRSLNVHISGAIMVWEYCKQHMIENEHKGESK